MGKYELSLTANYVADWTIVEAAREFFQNAIDQANTVPDNDMFHSYDAGTQLLTIGNKKSVLTARSLLLGATTKADDTSTIGKFGEGYKLATLVAIREGHNVVFYNYGANEVWRPRFVKSRRYNGENILTFFTESFTWKKPPDNNLTITIDKVSPGEYQAIVGSNLNLHDDLGKTYNTPNGTILCDDRYTGKVFVSGLLIGHYDELHYGYDINPAYVALDRDRRMLDTFKVKWQTASMWVASGSDEILSLAADSAADVEYAADVWGTINPSVLDKANDSFRKQYGYNAIPVHNQSELQDVLARYDDAEPIMMTGTQYKLVTSAPTYIVSAKPKEEVSTKDKLNEWFDRIRHKLTEEEAMEYYEISSEL